MYQAPDIFYLNTLDRLSTCRAWPINLLPALLCAHTEADSLDRVTVTLDMVCSNYISKPRNYVVFIHGIERTINSTERHDSGTEFDRPDRGSMVFGWVKGESALADYKRRRKAKMFVHLAKNSLTSIVVLSIMKLIWVASVLLLTGALTVASVNAMPSRPLWMVSQLFRLLR